jgi:hypothetical protein
MTATSATTASTIVAARSPEMTPAGVEHASAAPRSPPTVRVIRGETGRSDDDVRRPRGQGEPGRDRHGRPDAYEGSPDDQQTRGAGDWLSWQGDAELGQPSAERLSATVAVRETTSGETTGGEPDVAATAASREPHLRCERQVSAHGVDRM